MVVMLESRDGRAMSRSTGFALWQLCSVCEESDVCLLACDVTLGQKVQGLLHASLERHTHLAGMCTAPACATLPRHDCASADRCPCLTCTRLYRQHWPECIPLPLNTYAVNSRPLLRHAGSWLLVPTSLPMSMQHLTHMPSLLCDCLLSSSSSK